FTLSEHFSSASRSHTWSPAAASVASRTAETRFLLLRTLAAEFLQSHGKGQHEIPRQAVALAVGDHIACNLPGYAGVFIQKIVCLQAQGRAFIFKELFLQVGIDNKRVYGKRAAITIVESFTQV